MFEYSYKHISLNHFDIYSRSVKFVPTDDKILRPRFSGISQHWQVPLRSSQDGPHGGVPWFLCYVPNRSSRLVVNKSFCELDKVIPGDHECHVTCAV